MVKVIEQARVTRRGGEEVTTTPAPVRPASDYPAAARFLWEYLRRQAFNAGATEKHQGRPGWLWEGTLSSAVRFLWPGLEDTTSRNAISALSRLLRMSGSVVTLQAGRGDQLGVLWVSDQYAPPPAAPFARPERRKAALVLVDQVDDVPPAPEPVDVPAPAPAPEVVEPVDVVDQVDEPEPVDEPPAAAEPVDQLAAQLADRERDLIALQRAQDDRERALIDRELALIDRQRDLLHRELAQLGREHGELAARLARLAGPASMS